MEQQEPNSYLTTIKASFPVIVTVLTLLSFAFATYFFIDHRYALSDTVKLVDLRLDYKITSDQSDRVQSQIWKIDDRYKSQDDMPETVKEQYRELHLQKQQLILSIKSLEEKQSKKTF